MDIGQYPQIATEVFNVLCERLRQTTAFLEETLFLEVPERLFSRLADLAIHHGISDGQRVRIDHKLSQEELGQSIGASRESVNKQLHDWESQGLIDFGRGYVLVHDMTTLGAAALRQNLTANSKRRWAGSALVTNVDRGSSFAAATSVPTP